MIDASVSYLENHRFVISEDSSGILRNLKNSLPELQTEIPEIVGFGIYGSRTLGREKTKEEIESGSKQSDVDLAVFYDGSVFVYDIEEAANDIDRPAPLKFVNHRLVPDIDRKNAILQEKKTHVWLIQQIREKVSEKINKTISIPNQEFSIVPVNISQRSINDLVSHFSVMPEVKQIIENDTEPLDMSTDSKVEALIYLFTLSVGKGVYRARTHALDEFEKRQDGDKIFAALMKYLTYWERTKDTIAKKRVNPVSYQGKLPITIDDARKYFRTSS